jgi:hypothetical protein
MTALRILAFILFIIVGLSVISAAYSALVLGGMLWTATLWQLFLETLPYVIELIATGFAIYFIITKKVPFV